MIWQLIRQGATGELEVEFKFQRRSCNLSFLSSPRRKRAPEPSLLAGYRLWKSLLLQIPDNIYVTMLNLLLFLTLGLILR